MVTLAIDIYDCTISALSSLFINPTSSTFNFLVAGSPVAQLYGAWTSNFFVVGTDGIIKFLSRNYDEAGLTNTLNMLIETSGTDHNGPPGTFLLNQNYPNPFNPVTTIEFELRVKSPVKVQLVVHNMIGSLVRELFSQTIPSGFYTMSWDSRDDAGELVPGGIYFYTLKANEMIETKRMLMMR